MVAITNKDASERLTDDETVDLSGLFQPPDTVEVWEIEHRAYEIHLADADTDAVENWLRAERELLAQRSVAAGGAREEGTTLT